VLAMRAGLLCVLAELAGVVMAGRDHVRHAQHDQPARQPHARPAGRPASHTHANQLAKASQGDGRAANQPGHGEFFSRSRPHDLMTEG